MHLIAYVTNPFILNRIYRALDIKFANFGEKENLTKSFSKFYLHNPCREMDIQM